MAIVDIVKYDGTPDVFAWKFPNNELSTFTQLIVNESQEAILYKGGQALDLFKSGTYTLDTKNIPLLIELIKIPFGGQSPFSAEVWYVNKVNSLDIKWGTASPIQLKDPKYNVFLPVRAHGQFGIRITDARKFLTKMVGTLPRFDKTNLTEYFKGLYLTKVKDLISSYLVKKDTSILEINAYLEEISEKLKEGMIPTLSEYGIELINFFVNDISTPENDTAVKKLKDAMAKKAEMDILGYDYTQERSFDTLEGAAKNQGTGSDLMSAGLGLGMGVGMTGTFAEGMGSIASGINTKGMKKCPKCGYNMQKDSKFCGNCGFDTGKENKKEDNGKVKCSSCGIEYSRKAKFCPECGDSYDPCVYCGADIKKGDIKCHECGKEIPAPCSKCGKLIKNNNAKFCSECGGSLSKNCPKCNTEIKGSPKFCPECGESLGKK